MRYFARVLLVATLLVLPHGPTAVAEQDWSAHPPAMQWSYKIVHLYDVFEVDFVYREREEEHRLFEEHLNRLGDEGWELVAMDESLLIFKRPR